MKTKTFFEKHFFSKIINIFIFLIFAIFPFIIQAQNKENKELIPGQAPTSDFVTYLNNVYNFSIAIAAILAIFMIALGAFIYIFTSAGNASKMMDAKDMIKNAVVGLVLTLVAFFILFIINPDLIKGTLSSPGRVIEKIKNQNAVSVNNSSSNNNQGANGTNETDSASGLSPNNTEVNADAEGKVILNWEEIPGADNYVVTVEDVTSLE